MKKAITFQLLTLLVILISFSSCTKVQDEIVGEWKSELMLDETTVLITWQFNTDGTLVRTYLMGEDLRYDNCLYSVEKKLTKTLITIEGSVAFTNYTDVNGLWQVEYFKDNTMKLRRIDIDPETKERESSSYLWREFTRLN